MNPKYICILKTRFPYFKYNVIKLKKGSVKVKKLAKLDVEQILCMESSRPRLFSLERRQLIEHMTEGWTVWIGIYSFLSHPTPQKNKASSK